MPGRSEEFTSALRHDPSCPAYNPHLRQLLHVGYKVAAKMGARYLDMLDAVRRIHRPQRHAQPLRAPHRPHLPIKTGTVSNLPFLRAVRSSGSSAALGRAA